MLLSVNDGHKKKMKTAYVNRLTLIEKNVNPTIVCVANRRRRG